MTNTTLIHQLRTHAKRLDEEGGNLFQVRAYRRAAETIARLEVPMQQWVAEHGEQALQDLPGIGSHIGFAIVCLLTKGTYHAMTEGYYRTPRGERVVHLPGLGPHVAELLWDKLAIHSVDALEQALTGGELQSLPISAKRQQQWLRAIQERRTVAVSQAG